MDDGVSDTTAHDAKHMDRGVARRHAFLEAAREVFLEQGYEAASVNDVVRRAGGSLATLYAQFGNKEGLFLAVTRDQQDRFVQAVTPECVDNLALEPGLQKIGEQFLTTILDKDNLAFFRIIVGEGRKYPQLLQRYSSSVADRVRAIITNYMKSCGAPIEALCGATFVPSRDPKGLPVCPKCKEQYDFLMVFRTDDKIKDDL